MTSSFLLEGQRWLDFESFGFQGGDMAWMFDEMGVSKNRGTPKSSILIGFSIINHPFWGTPIFGNIQMFGMFGMVVTGPVN